MLHLNTRASQRVKMNKLFLLRDVRLDTHTHTLLLENENEHMIFYFVLDMKHAHSCRRMKMRILKCLYYYFLKHGCPGGSSWFLGPFLVLMWIETRLDIHLYIWSPNFYYHRSLAAHTHTYRSWLSYTVTIETIGCIWLAHAQ